MDLKVRAPGWVRWEWKDGVSAEIKVLNLEEYQLLQGDLREVAEGKTSAEKMNQAIFRRYVRAIKGLTVNGNAVTRPEDLLDAGMGASLGLLELIVGSANQFFTVNTITEEEGKNSAPPPAKAGEVAEEMSPRFSEQDT
jgi:hypothetical protein